jgi:hypothetical protein
VVEEAVALRDADEDLGEVSELRCVRVCVCVCM